MRFFLTNARRNHDRTAAVRQTDRLTGREYEATRKIKDKERERRWAGGIVVIGRLERGGESRSIRTTTAARSLDVDGQRERRQVDAIEDEGREGGSRGTKETNRVFRLLRRGRIKGMARRRWTAERRAEAARKEDQKGPGRNSETRPKRERKKKKKSQGQKKTKETRRQPERERGRSTSTLPHGLERAEPGQERPVRGRMQAVGQNDTGTGKSNHEPIWTRSYSRYRARRPSRDDRQAKRRKGNGRKVADIGQYQTAPLVLPWPTTEDIITLLVTDMSVLAHYSTQQLLLTEHTQEGEGKEKKKKADSRRERYSVKGDGYSRYRGDTILAPRADVWPTGINQVLPFSHPRPIDRSSGLARRLPGRHHTRTPPSTAPSSTHTGHQTR